MELDLTGLRVKEHTIKPLFGGFQLVMFFENGRGVSVIQHDYSYGGPQGLYELAELDASGEIVDIGEDVVMGWLTKGQVMEMARNIAKL